MKLRCWPTLPTLAGASEISQGSDSDSMSQLVEQFTKYWSKRVNFSAKSTSSPTAKPETSCDLKTQCGMAFMRNCSTNCTVVFSEFLSSLSKARFFYGT